MNSVSRAASVRNSAWPWLSVCVTVPLTGTPKLAHRPSGPPVGNALVVDLLRLCDCVVSLVEEVESALRRNQ